MAAMICFNMGWRHISIWSQTLASMNYFDFNMSNKYKYCSTLWWKTVIHELMLTDAEKVVHNLCDPVDCSIFQPVKLSNVVNRISGIFVFISNFVQIYLYYIINRCIYIIVRDYNQYFKYIYLYYKCTYITHFICRYL